MKKNTEEFKKDSILLMDIVNEKLGLNILTKRRTQNLVDARSIYAKILHDKGYSYPAIGMALRKDHSTIVHHVQKIEDFLPIEPALNDKYMAIRDEFFEKSEVSLYNDDFNAYRKELLAIKDRIKFMEIKEQKLSKLELRYKRLQNIINFIDENTLIGEEEKIKCKIFAAIKS